VNQNPKISAPASPARRPRSARISDWITRPVFGLLLAGAALAAIFAGTAFVALMAAIAAGLGAREWHSIVGGGKFSRAMYLTTAVIVFALADFVLYGRVAAALFVLALGTAVILGVEFYRGGRYLWQAVGVLYLGLPALALVTLRATPNGHGAWLILGLCAAVWATDTGALVFGNLIGGPKLAPRISPNKTWSGFFGGIVAAAAVDVLFAWIIGVCVWSGAIFGAGLAVTAHGGDLFESAFKRRFRVKDSSDLIPGHGGVLDRIDFTLAAVLMLAVLVYGFHVDLNAFFGVRS
jgi:phosphatidate cytidylyltransferase